MKKASLIIILTAMIMMTACNNSKKAIQQINAKTIEYPTLDGYKIRIIPSSSLKSETDASNLKIEIVPGKTMEVDCNTHFLIGEFEKKAMDNGTPYYLFQSNGEVVSTMMACLDNTKQQKFVQGAGQFVDYNAEQSIVIYAPENIDIKHRIWQAGATYSVAKEVNLTVKTEATDALKAYPASLEGHDRYVLILSEVSEGKKDLNVEIIPGITADVDYCNRHRLMGKFIEKEIDGWGYNYLIFESDGNIASTRMGCPDNTLKSEFVTGETRMMKYNSRLPLVIFAPKGRNFDVKYRIWESPLLEE